MSASLSPPYCVKRRYREGAKIGKGGDQPVLQWENLLSMNGLSSVLRAFRTSILTRTRTLTPGGNAIDTGEAEVFSLQDLGIIAAGGISRFLNMMPAEKDDQIK